MAMKSISVSGLKNNLSRTLRRVQRGERIVVFDRSAAVAELIPVQVSADAKLARLTADGQVRPGNQNFTALSFAPMRPAVRIQQSLKWVRGD